MRLRRKGMKNSQGGAMLLEALIGLLIFSIGIIALIGLQGAAMKNSLEAKHRADASFLANQIIAAMWVDRANLAEYDTDSGAGNQTRDDWMDRVQATLPGVVLQGAGVANVPSITVAGDQVTVQVFWRKPGDDPANPDSRHNFVTSAWINNS